MHASIATTVGERARRALRKLLLKACKQDSLPVRQQAARKLAALARAAAPATLLKAVFTVCGRLVPLVPPAIGTADLWTTGTGVPLG